RQRVRMQPGAPGTDRWHATVTPDRPGAWTLHVEGWGDPIATWRHDAAIKVPAGLDVELMLEEGARLIERVAATLAKTKRRPLDGAVAALRDTNRPVEARFAAALAPRVTATLEANPIREPLTESAHHPVFVQRERALFSSWYEMFPRSEG